MLERLRLVFAGSVLRSLSPSPTSAALCLLIGACAMLVNLTLTGLKAGALLPDFLDGDWATAYARFFAGPLKDFLDKTSLNSALLVVLWGFIGLVVYTVAEHASRNYREWREAETDIQIIGPQRIVNHPLQNSFFLTLLRRIILAGLFVIWLVAAVLVLKATEPTNSPAAFYGISKNDVLWRLQWIGLEWALLMHALVVLLRLASQHARLFETEHPGGNEHSLFHA